MHKEVTSAHRVPSAVLTTVLVMAATVPLNAAKAADGLALLDAAGIQGGLVVHLGCGDGRLTAALHDGDAYLVHGLDRDPANVAAARQHVRSLGLYGPVCIDTFDGQRLPYIDNLVNLLVADRLGDVSMEEVVRVLTPGGVALVAGKKTVKPWPEDIDEWTHYLHDASNNAVAEDHVVGPPKHYQWIGSPRWLRHHDHMSGLAAMVSTAGRLFTIIDLGPRWSVQMPPQWTLVARDAFNGTILWQRPINPWHAHLWPLKKGPAQQMRRLVAKGDTVYVTLGVGKAVSALDAVTGKTLRTYQGTEGAEEMILADGVLYVVIHPEGDAYKELPRESVGNLRAAGAKWNWDEKPRRIAAIDVESGRTLWTKESRVAPCTLAAAGGRVYFHDGDCVVCLGAGSGLKVWTSPPVARWNPMHVLFGPTLVVYGDVILFAGGENMDFIRGGKDTMTALSAETGARLWTAPHPPSGYASSEDLLVADGLVWCGVTTSRRDSGVFTGRDPKTGEVKVEFPPDDWLHMPHHRCYRAKATCDYILASRTGIEFVDFRKKHWTSHHWVRGSCNYGILPCNGLVYAPPHSCACYPVAKLNGLNALAAARGGESLPNGDGDSARLQRGPAYSEDPASPIAEADAAAEWPTFRGDAARSGSTRSAVPTELKRRWTTRIGGRLSTLVAAGGRVFVAAVDEHTVHALDADTGSPVWQFTAGGRVDSPPSLWRDRVLFGSADGFVYCLRADDGRLVWRFRAAPDDRRMTASEQVESVWPVHGSVLVREGIVYCVAGRSMWLDGGLRLLRLDAADGHKISETVLDDKYPGSEDTLQRDVKWPNLPVALPDVLSCDGQYVYMRSQPFNLEGRRTEVITTRDATVQRGPTAHLFSPTGFLDDSWWHRTYWIFGRSFVGGAGGWYLAGYQAPAGRILAMDEGKIYGFGRVPMRQVGTPTIHHLFACDRQPEMTAQGGPRKRGASIYGPIVPMRINYDWSHSVPIMVRAMVAADESLFVAGPPQVADEDEVYALYGADEMQAKMAEHVAAFEGRKGGLLLAVSKQDGSRRAAFRLPSTPVFDGMIAAAGRLFLAMRDGSVVCLGGDGPEPLEPTPDVTPGPVSVRSLGFMATMKHADFQHLDTVQVIRSDLGYRIQTAPADEGFALKKLAAPLKKRAEFRVKVRPSPGAFSPDTPGNGFLAFGNSTEDAQLVKCGFRIAGRHLYVLEGPLAKGRGKSKVLVTRANEVSELRVVVDLDKQKVTASMGGETVEAKLTQRLEQITWLGYAVASVTTDFGPIEVEGE